MIDVLFVSYTPTLTEKIFTNRCEDAGLHCETVFAEACDPLEKAIRHNKPKILAIHWNFNEYIYQFLSTSLPQIKKELPEMQVVVYSYGATNDWKNLSETEFIDYIFGGEGDDVFSELCIRILQKEKVDKLEYLNTPTPDLKKYDYDRNFIIHNRTLVISTSRNCVYSMSGRCWYCCLCYARPYRLLDIDKIVDSLRKNVDFNNIDCIKIDDAETLPQNINRLWEEFHKPIHAFVLFKDLLKLSPNLKDSRSNLIFGVNYKREGLHSNVEYTPQQIDVILDRVKDNLRGNCLSTTMLITTEQDKDSYKDIIAVFDKYKELINCNFCYYRKTPRNETGDELKENIYKEYRRNPYVWHDCVMNIEDYI